MPFGEERDLSNLMMKGMNDFVTCRNMSLCEIGKYHRYPSWPTYQHGMIVLQTPISTTRIARDAALDSKCKLYRDNVSDFERRNNGKM